jgi:hypothetical protein
LRSIGRFLWQFAKRTFATFFVERRAPKTIHGFGRRPLEGHSTKQRRVPASGIGLSGLSDPAPINTSVTM